MGREVRRSGIGGKREEGQNEGQKRDSEAEDSQGRDAGSWRRKLETQSKKRSGGGTWSPWRLGGYVMSFNEHTVRLK